MDSSRLCSWEVILSAYVCQTIGIKKINGDLSRNILMLNFLLKSQSRSQSAKGKLKAMGFARMLKNPAATHQAHAFLSLNWIY